MNEVKGLTWKQATKALRQYGLNDVKIKSESGWLLFLSQFASPLVFLLIAASIISFILHNYINGVIILIILAVNTFIGFIQEYKSKNTFKQLNKLVKSNVYVIRDSKKVLINKSTVVPGDILVLKLGDVVCADCYVIEQDGLLVDESTLTGASEDIYKEVNNKKERGFAKGNLYSGSYIVSGDCVAEVFATGNQSKFGEIEFSANKTVKLSAYEENLRKLTRIFLVISVIAIAVIFLANALFKREESIETILLFTIAISIAIIPEALPIVANLTLTRSALRLSNKKVIVKHNSAIEDLGNIDIICTDKTGTLTLNKLKVDFYNTVISNKDFLKYSYLSTVDNSDEIDKCIFKYLKDQGTEDHSEFLLEEIPFDPEKKFSARKFKDFEIIKGSPEYIFDLTKNDSKLDRELIELNSEKGLRVISLAVKDTSNIKYIGSYFFFDEIKEDVEHVIERARSLGIALKIITGDSKEVSGFVGVKVGLISNLTEVIEANDLDFDNSEILFEQVTKHSVFARCNPEQKYKIIECLQTKHFVAYLGDGINDAPSLAVANVGLVVDTATDISKEDSDIILLSSGLDVIIDAVVEGRSTFENIDKYLRSSLAGNFGGFFTIGLLSAFLRYLPILPIQIFISNLLTDFPLLAISTDNLDSEELKKPKHYSLNKTLIFAGIFGIVSLVFNLVFFYIVRNQEVNLIQTQWFALSVVTELIIIFSLRTKKSIFNIRTSKPSGILIKLSMLSLTVTLLLALFGLPGEFIGIPLTSFALIGIISGVYFMFTEAIKVPIIRMLKL